MLLRNLSFRIVALIAIGIALAKYSENGQIVP
jgi:hypothetical protein